MFSYLALPEQFQSLATHVEGLPRELGVDEALLQIVQRDKPQTLVFAGVALPAFDITSARIVAELTGVLDYNFATAAGLALMHKNHAVIPSELRDTNRLTGDWSWLEQTLLEHKDVIDPFTAEVATVAHLEVVAWALRPEVLNYARGELHGKTGNGRAKAKIQRAKALGITEEMTDSFNYFEATALRLKNEVPNWEGKLCILPVPGLTTNITVASEVLDGKVIKLLADGSVSLKMAIYTQRQFYTALVDQSCLAIRNAIKLISEFSQFQPQETKYLVQIYRELNPIVDAIFRAESDAKQRQEGENIFGAELRKLVLLKLDISDCSTRELTIAEMDAAIGEAMLRCQLAFRLCLSLDIEKAVGPYTAVVAHVNEQVALWRSSGILDALFNSTLPLDKALSQVANYDLAQSLSALTTLIEREQ